MTEGSDFQPRADDDARDPLLSALRQRLGERFGQAAPPELWASIRQQLPPAAPHPWWLRSRRLLALLMLVGGVLLGGVAVWLTRPARRAASRLAHVPVAQSAAPADSHANSSQPGAAVGPATASPAAPRSTTPTANSPATVISPLVGATSPAASNQDVAAARAPRAAARTEAQAARGQATRALASNGFGESILGAQAIRHAKRQTRRVALLTHGSRRQRATGALAGATTASQSAVSSRLSQPGLTEPANYLSATTAATLAAAGQPAPAAPERSVTAALPAASAAPRGPRGVAALRRSTGQLATATTAAASPSQRQLRAAEALAGPGGGRRMGNRLANPSAAGQPTTAPPAALDSLAELRARLQLAALALPVPLAQRPDSAGPWLPPARRWSVLVLAGPTISYRTSGVQLPSNLQYASGPLSSSGPNSSATVATPATLFDQERPAVGLGLQGQLRRVLTGRWALAAGVGYQEYATWLTTQVTLRRSTSNTYAPDTTLGLNHRDTYRFLTLPVQLSYALGPPHGRVSLGVLGGLEPSWYQGGTATILTGTTVNSLSFSSASGSAYNSFSLGISLGLDARIRLGGPASRWLLLVQPTARYLATPFVRGNTGGYAARQPYSLGLLTGFAWQLP